MHSAPWIRKAAAFGALCLGLLAGPVAASDEAADAMVKRLATEVMEAARAPGGETVDARALRELVDRKIMPNVNFGRMTAAVVGRAWRQATPEQQERLQEEFKLLLVRTYAGALTQLKDRTIAVKPLRAGGDDTEVTVRTLVKGQGEPVAIDYRLEKTPAGWKIVDLNVMGVWLVEAYRGQFATEVNARGLDGLIATLSERNRLVAKAS